MGTKPIKPTKNGVESSYTAVPSHKLEIVEFNFSRVTVLSQAISLKFGKVIFWHGARITLQEVLDSTLQFKVLSIFTYPHLLYLFKQFVLKVEPFQVAEG